ncbi:MAG: HEAT repeat domain-containing protein [bacterium]
MPPSSSAPISNDEPEVAAAIPTRKVVVQFFVGPLLIVLLCAGIYFLFGVVVFEKKSPSDFLTQIRSGSSSERWQAAFELSRWFASAPDAARDPQFASEIVRLFEQSTHEDPRVRRYLALALGRLGSSAAVVPLIAALDDSDPETQLYAAWSLGAIKDRAAIEPLTQRLHAEDAGMVKMASFALGTIGDPSVAPLLVPLLEHASAEVRWNSALALAQLGDASGRGVLLGMTEPEELARVAGMSDVQKSEAMSNALIALHRIGDPAGAERIRALAASAPYSEVRRVAASLLAGQKSS